MLHDHAEGHGDDVPLRVVRVIEKDTLRDTRRRTSGSTIACQAVTSAHHALARLEVAAADHVHRDVVCASAWTTSDARGVHAKALPASAREQARVGVARSGTIRSRASQAAARQPRCVHVVLSETIDEAGQLPDLAPTTHKFGGGRTVFSNGVFLLPPVATVAKESLEHENALHDEMHFAPYRTTRRIREWKKNGHHYANRPRGTWRAELSVTGDGLRLHLPRLRQDRTRIPCDHRPSPPTHKATCHISSTTFSRSAAVSRAVAWRSGYL